MYCKKIAEILSAIFLYINSPLKLEAYLVKVPTQIRSFVRKTPHQIGRKFIFLHPHSISESHKIKTESYNTIILDNNYIKANDIIKLQMPINLNIAYSEYQHQS